VRLRAKFEKDGNVKKGRGREKNLSLRTSFSRKKKKKGRESLQLFPLRKKDELAE